MLSFGEYEFNVDQLELWDCKDKKVKTGYIEFETFNKNFTFKIDYKGVYLRNKVFAGHFYGLLTNQGVSKANFMTFK